MPTPSATTVRYLLTAVYEALTTVTSKPRCLATAELFVKGYPVGFDVGVRARGAFNSPQRKACFVGLGERVAGDNLELGDDHIYAYSLFISRDYWIGYEGTAQQPTSGTLNEVETAFITEADDFMRVRAALCYPGALEVTAALQATGLAGYALAGPTARSRPRIESAPEGNQRLLNAVDTFTAHFLFDPD